jgi:hypothetical protein
MRSLVYDPAISRVVGQLLPGEVVGQADDGYCGPLGVGQVAGAGHKRQGAAEAHRVSRPRPDSEGEARPQRRTRGRGPHADHIGGRNFLPERRRVPAQHRVLRAPDQRPAKR